jgi:hypothetical protein
MFSESPIRLTADTKGGGRGGRVEAALWMNQIILLRCDGNFHLKFVLDSIEMV